MADRGASAAGGDAGDRILGFGSLDNFGPYLTAFRKGLNEAGSVEGQNVANSPCSMIARAGAGVAIEHAHQADPAATRREW